MNHSFIVDAHVHLGEPGSFFLPETTLSDLLRRMDELDIMYAITSHQRSLYDVTLGWDQMHAAYEESNGRVVYLGVFDPRHPGESLKILGQEVSRTGFIGIKIHPSIHHTPAESPDYEPVWKFADEHKLTLLTHSWSVSSYNPIQQFSTPERFEIYIQRFPDVKLVLGHAGGRGAGRISAIRLARNYTNVYLDFAGDIFCFHLLENLCAELTAEKILFGSDFPWFDPSSHLTRVLLSEIPEEDKLKILSVNALQVYGINQSAKEAK